MTDISNIESSTLPRLQPSLPAELYSDPAVYQEELTKIWYQQWIYAGRVDGLSRPGDYRLTTIGNQTIIITLNREGQVRAFYNTCRHRGAELCQAQQGHFKQDRITCPYHRWSYSLEGALLNTPNLEISNDHHHFGLYPVKCQSWGGNIYINLDSSSPLKLGETADPDFTVLDNWPLEQLKLGHTHQFELACNWKIFWENYLECYHCPGIHPDLCKLVPLYKAALATDRIDPGAELADAVASGIESWTTTGKAISLPFEGLSTEQANAGHTFMELYPNQYIVAHSDYVRQVSISPLSAERTRVTTEWLFSAEAMKDPDFDPAPAIDFSKQVLAEDRWVNELNQRGVTALPPQNGYLVPVEADVGLFHEMYSNWMSQ